MPRAWSVMDYLALSRLSAAIHCPRGPLGSFTGHFVQKDMDSDPAPEVGEFRGTTVSSTNHLSRDAMSLKSFTSPRCLNFIQVKGDERRYAL